MVVNNKINGIFSRPCVNFVISLPGIIQDLCDNTLCAGPYPGTACTVILKITIRNYEVEVHSNRNEKRSPSIA